MIGFHPRHKYGITAKNIDLMTFRSIRDTLASLLTDAVFSQVNVLRLQQDGMMYDLQQNGSIRSHLPVVLRL